MELQKNSKQVMVNKKVWKPQNPTVVKGLYHEWKSEETNEMARLVVNIINETTAGDLNRAMRTDTMNNEVMADYQTTLSKTAAFAEQQMYPCQPHL